MELCSGLAAMLCLPGCCCMLTQPYARDFSTSARGKKLKVPWGGGWRCSDAFRIDCNHQSRWTNSCLLLLLLTAVLITVTILQISRWKHRQARHNSPSMVPATTAHLLPLWSATHRINHGKRLPYPGEQDTIDSGFRVTFPRILRSRPNLREKSGYERWLRYGLGRVSVGVGVHDCCIVKCRLRPSIHALIADPSFFGG
jgi:hypothetical protein